MFRSLKGAVLALGLVAAPVAYAQEQSSEGGGANAAAGLDLGQEVSPDPSYIKETFDDWQLQCIRTDQEEDPCQMYQLLREEAGNPVAEISIFKLPGGSDVVAGATIVVPLGTLLTAGLQMYVDDGPAKAYNFSFCSAVGCFARVGFSQQDVDAFKAGGEAFLIIVPAQAPDQSVLIKASLAGFTKAFESTSATPG